MKIKGSPKNLRIIVKFKNMYEFRLVMDGLKRIKPIVEECKNNPELKKEMR